MFKRKNSADRYLQKSWIIQECQNEQFEEEREKKDEKEERKSKKLCNNYCNMLLKYYFCFNTICDLSILFYYS